MNMKHSHSKPKIMGESSGFVRSPIICIIMKLNNLQYTQLDYSVVEIKIMKS